MEDQSHLRVLTQIIDRLTDKRHADLDPDTLTRLKRLCKSIGDSAIKTAFTIVMEKIREQHARVGVCRRYTRGYNEYLPFFWQYAEELKAPKLIILC